VQVPCRKAEAREAPSRSKRTVRWLANSTKEVLTATGIFVLLALLFTLISLLISPPSTQVGSARPFGEIPIHEVELGGLGALLGAVALGIYGQGGAVVALMLPALSILVDLDHLPSFLGIAQPIRPAHSIFFLVADIALTAIVLRRMDFSLIAMSAFAGHLGIDTGLAPPLSPISFDYVQLDPYRVPLLVISTITAFAAGYLLRRSRRRT